jgi:hypothetical protein
MARILRIFLFAALTFSAAAPAMASIEGNAYRTSYVCSDLNGRRRWTATAEIRHKEGDIYTIIEKMKGVYTNYRGEISWVATTDFERTKDAVKPLNMDQRIFNAAGKLIAISKQSFDYDTKVVTCTYEDLVMDTVSKKEFAFTGDIINRLLQGLCGQKLIEAGLASKEMQVISPEPAIYNIRLEMVGRDDIEVNGVKRSAYKLCFDPQLGMFDFVKVFLPKSYAWHSAEPIFEWLRYEGLESGVDSPSVEILSLEKDATTSIPLPESAKP